MKLYQAIKYAISKDGIKIIREQRFANYLADLQAYETPAIRRVVAAIVREGYCNKLHDGLLNNSYQLTFNDVSYQLTHNEGFQEDIVRFVLNSLLYATQKTYNEPTFEYNTPVRRPEAPAPIPEPRRNSISKEDIKNFFDLEAEAGKARWEATMKLPVKDRIRKRKAIKDVYLDRNFSEISEDRKNLLKVSAGVNLADFKEGESLILHKENTTAGIRCNLNAFQDDDTIILEAYSMPSDIESFYGIPLLLDKDELDLRRYVYNPFIDKLPDSTDDFWKKLILNSRPEPTFDDKEQCEKYLAKTLQSFNLYLLPKQKEAIINSMQAQDYYLIQGPPGTGKSFVLSVIMFEEIFNLKHNVIVVGPNHMAINNAMGQFVKFSLFLPPPIIVR